MAYTLIFLFELAIVLTRTVNILTANKLIKLTMLWTTGLRGISFKLFADISLGTNML